MTTDHTTDPICIPDFYRAVAGRGIQHPRPLRAATSPTHYVDAGSVPTKSILESTCGACVPDFDRTVF
jgi:hypothetical protein